MKILLMLSMALAVSSALAEGPTIESPLSVLPQAEQRECEAFGETYLRLVELRDAGADKLVAIERGVEFLSKLGRTGSHHRGMNYRPAVTQFAGFVYGNPKLQRGTVYLYGLSSCAISKAAPDDAAFDGAMTDLEKSIGRCQAKFPGQARVKQLGACVLDPVHARLRLWTEK